jgi:hypothetical protein
VSIVSAESLFVRTVSAEGIVSIFIHRKVLSWFENIVHRVYFPVRVSITRLIPFLSVSRFAFKPVEEIVLPAVLVYVVEM